MSARQEVAYVVYEKGWPVFTGTLGEACAFLGTTPALLRQRERNFARYPGRVSGVVRVVLAPGESERPQARLSHGKGATAHG